MFFVTLNQLNLKVTRVEIVEVKENFYMEKSRWKFSFRQSIKPDKRIRMKQTFLRNYYLLLWQKTIRLSLKNQ